MPVNDPYGVGPITQIDITNVNVAEASAEAWDTQIDYSFAPSSWGEFSAWMIGTWQTQSRTQLLPTTAEVENVGITGFPLKFKATAGLNWSLRNWSAGWSVSHFHSYKLATLAQIASQGGETIPSQTYHDIFGKYTMPTAAGSSGWWNALTSGVEVRVGVQNLFNTRPPFDASASVPAALYYYSFYGSPRLASYYLSLKKSF